MTIVQQLCRFGSLVIVVVVSTAAPQWVHAHGETELRIATLSRKISTATTNAAPLYLSRGELHREHQDWPAAEADYAQAAKLQPELTAIDLCRAHLLADMGKLDAAEAMFTKTLVRSPREGEAFIGRARVFMRLNRVGKAIRDFQRGLALLENPQPEYFIESAQALVIEKRSDEALRILEDGIKRLGQLVPLQEHALQLELERKDLEAALRRIDQILDVVPRKESWLARRGEVLLLAHRPVEAQQSFQAALKAIDALPPILQKSPAVVPLINRVRDALARLTAKPVVVDKE